MRGKKVTVLKYVLLQMLTEYCFICICFIRIHMVNHITNCNTGFIYEIIHNMNIYSSHEKPCCQLQKFLPTGSQQTWSSTVTVLHCSINVGRVLSGDEQSLISFFQYIYIYTHLFFGLHVICYTIMNINIYTLITLHALCFLLYKYSHFVFQIFPVCIKLSMKRKVSLYLC